GTGYTVGTPGSATIDIADNDGPAQVVPSPNSCGCSGQWRAVGQKVITAQGEPRTMVSEGPVRFFDGVAQIESSDLGSGGFGVPWGQNRSWTNGLGYTSTTFGGSNTAIPQLPYLRQDSNNVIAVIESGTDARFFDLVGGTYQSRYFLKETLTHNTGTN